MRKRWWRKTGAGSTQARRDKVGGSESILSARTSGTDSGETSASDQTPIERGSSDPARKSRLEVWADHSSHIRTLVLNVLVLVAVVLLGKIALWDRTAIVLGHIDVSGMPSTHPMKEADVRSELTGEFREAYSFGGEAMPAEVIENDITDEADQFNFQIPDVGLPFTTVASYLRKEFGRQEAIVTGTLTVKEGQLALRAQMIDPDNGPVGFDGTGDFDQPQVLLSQGATELLRERNPYVYASTLSVIERKACYDNPKDCEFPRAWLAYQYVQARDESRGGLFRRLANLNPWRHGGLHYAEWALLGQSKIKEDARAYTDEATLARRATQRWSTFSWAYYNWGVALVELGCSDGAVNAFSQTIAQNPTYAPAFNARGRIHLMRAQLHDDAGGHDHESERRKALRDFRQAVLLESNYAEAHINLGKTHRLESSEYLAARAEFDATIENASQHKSRALQQLALLDTLQGNPTKANSEMQEAKSAKSTNQVCSSEFSESLREASGCMEPPEGRTPSRAQPKVECKLLSEGLPAAVNDEVSGQ
jgi:tetratricopeptide (TPR) repeat protein